MKLYYTVDKEIHIIYIQDLKKNEGLTYKGHQYAINALIDVNDKYFASADSFEIIIWN